MTNKIVEFTAAASMMASTVLPALGAADSRQVLPVAPYSRRVLPTALNAESDWSFVALPSIIQSKCVFSQSNHFAWVGIAVVLTEPMRVTEVRSLPVGEVFFVGAKNTRIEMSPKNESSIVDLAGHLTPAERKEAPVRAAFHVDALRKRCREALSGG